MQRLAFLPLLLLPAAALSADAPPVVAIQKIIDATYPALDDLYKHIHAHPELALHEEKTAARLAKELAAAGFAVTPKVGGHGVVAVFKNGKGPTILVRADMDALPIEEKTGLAYASKEHVRDADGKLVGVMHACGHDVNVTCLVGTARVLVALKDRWSGTLVFIGQPAEEIGAGARAMLADGLFTRFPRPDFALALHCDARYPAGHVNWRIGQLQANVDSVTILVRGKGAHGAAPHAAIDPIVIAARLVLDLQTISSRERDPLDPVVVTVGSIHGGTKHNIIPSEVKLELTVRTVNDATRKKTLDAITRMSKAAARAAAAPEPSIQIALDDYTPALENDPALTKKVVGILRDTLGPDRVHERPMSLGGEDFSQYVRAGVPGCYFFLGSAAPERVEAAKRGGPPLAFTHTDAYYPVPEPTIKTGVLSMIATVMKLAPK
ncbi:MAG: amidohydrolase [Gemmataceae bacterium]